MLQQKEKLQQKRRLQQKRNLLKVLVNQKQNHPNQNLAKKHLVVMQLVLLDAKKL